MDDDKVVTGAGAEGSPSEQEAAAVAAAEEATAGEASEKKDAEGKADEAALTPDAEEEARRKHNREAAEKRISARKQREDARIRDLELENATLKGRNEALQGKGKTGDHAEESPVAAYERENPKPKEADFQTHSEWVEALTDWKVTGRDWMRDQKAKVEAESNERRTAQTTIMEKVQAVDREGISRYDDFDIVTHSDNLMLSDMQKVYLVNSEPGVAADLEYYLGTNPAENERIARLTPFLQQKEMVLLENKIASGTVQLKKTTKAPPPAETVDGKNASTGKNIFVENIDTNDRIKMIREQRLARQRQ
jgi:hypothetical protein